MHVCIYYVQNRLFYIFLFLRNFYILNTNAVIWSIPSAVIYFCIIPESIFHKQFVHSQEKQFLQCPNSHPVLSHLTDHFKYAVCSLNPSSIRKDAKHIPTSRRKYLNMISLFSRNCFYNSI